MEKLVIGVNTDQPGLGEKISETGKSYDAYAGFDIRVAKEIARNLGVNAANVSFEPVTSSNREELLEKGKVDLIVASYSITPDRKRDGVLFGGPYYVAHQDVMVRQSDAATIESIHDLAGKKVCKVEGSLSFERIKEEQGILAEPVNAAGYGKCLEKLIAGQLHAVSTDDLILAGLARRAAEQGHFMEVVGAPISDERYGVGLRAGDVDGCEAVNEAITKMYQDDTIPVHLHRWFDDSGLEPVETVPQFEGCE
ncbi:transporter substrate-binding domain-containing protein [Actinomadura sp. CNU-125]|uniref:transporter substrate-binding domain-containing protein n=1 Tax=Actinomadura sp. CNU-125 TaxID=1904961 RepID=UPI00096A4D83|nr:transporter substrate-binding domain-containing protein [Actinomadura sp. CNU-125]